MIISETSEIEKIKNENNVLKRALKESHETENRLRKRLIHLFQSDFISSFDEIDRKTGEYIRDIKEADKFHSDVISLINELEQEKAKNRLLKRDIIAKDSYISIQNNFIELAERKLQKLSEIKEIISND